MNLLSMLLTPALQYEGQMYVSSLLHGHLSIQMFEVLDLQITCSKHQQWLVHVLLMLKAVQR